MSEAVRLDLPGGGGGAPRGIVGLFLLGKAGAEREGGGFGEELLWTAGGRERLEGGGGLERPGGGGGLLRPGPGPGEGAPPRDGGEGSCRPPPALEWFPWVERVLPVEIERGKLSDPDEEEAE